MSRRAWMAIVTLLGVLLVAAGAGAAATGNRRLMMLAVCVCVLPLLCFALMKRPGVLAAIPGIVLGFMPFAAVQGTGFPLVIALTLLLIVLAVVHPSKDLPKIGPLGVIVTCYLLFSLISAVATYHGSQTLVEYAKWALAMGAMVIVLLMEVSLRRILFGAYGIAAAVGALFSVGMLLVDRSGSWVNRFSFLGYGGSIAVNERTASVGGSVVARAAGLYVDPNSAGLFFLFAIAVAAYALRGTLLVVVVGALSIGVLATLSRAAIASLLLAAAFALFFSKISAGKRFVGSVLLFSGVFAAFMVPAVSSRLFDSFGSGDIGCTARIDALRRYPGHMSGNWFFGRGWDLREFSDPFYGYTINHAANTPLIVVYRAGLLTGVVFVIVLIIALVLGFRAMRAGRHGAALQTGVLFALVLIAFQLDFPVVTMPPLAMAFALVLASIQSQAIETATRDRIGDGQYTKVIEAYSAPAYAVTPAGPRALTEENVAW